MNIIGNFASLKAQSTAPGTVALVSIAIPILGFPIISTLLFPFYAYLGIKNRKETQISSISAFISYFYRITCFTELIFYFGLIILTFNCKLAPPLRLQPWIFFWTGYFYHKVTVAVMLNVLTSLLALHRSIVFFFPKCAITMTKYQQILITYHIITVFRRKVSLQIWGLHILMLFAVSCVIEDSKITIRPSETSNSRRLIFQIFLYSLFLISHFLYFLMLLKSPKQNNMNSNFQSNQEEPLKVQILIILISKLFIIPVLLCNRQSVGTPLFTMHLICETTMASLTIQLSYFLRDNSCCRGKESRVEPVELAYSVPAIENEVEPAKNLQNPS